MTSLWSKWRCALPLRQRGLFRTRPRANPSSVRTCSGTTQVSVHPKTFGLYDMLGGTTKTLSLATLRMFSRLDLARRPPAATWSQEDCAMWDWMAALGMVRRAPWAMHRGCRWTMAFLCPLPVVLQAVCSCAVRPRTRPGTLCFAPLSTAPMRGGLHGLETWPTLVGSCGTSQTSWEWCVCVCVWGVFEPTRALTHCACGSTTVGGLQVVAEPGVPAQFRFSVAGILSASEAGHDAPPLSTHDAAPDLAGSWRSYSESAC
jgi:hypothetical protein